MKNLTLASLVASSALAVTLGVTGMTHANTISANSANASQSTSFTADTVMRGERGQHRGKHQGEHRGKRGGMHRAFSKLDLTEAQQTQIDAIMDAKKAEREANRNAMQAEREQRHEQMQAVMNQATLNQAQVNRMANEHAEQAKQQFIDRIEMQHAIAQVLTPEQRTQLEAMRAERGDRRSERGGR